MSDKTAILDSIVVAISGNSSLGYVIERDGKPVAVLMHLGRYDELCAALRELEH